MSNIEEEQEQGEKEEIQVRHRGYPVRNKTRYLMYYCTLSLVFMPILTGILWLTGIETIPEQIVFLVLSLLFLSTIFVYPFIPLYVYYDAKKIVKSPNRWDLSPRRYFFVTLVLLFIPPLITVFLLYYITRRYIITGHL